MTRKWTYDGKYTVEDGCYAVAAIHGTTGAKSEEARANARLIAAAPELLAALVECVGEMANYDEAIARCTEDEPDYYETWSKAMNNASAAIDRAKGGQ